MRRLGELCSKAVTLFLLDQTEVAEAAERSDMEKRVAQTCTGSDIQTPMTDDAKTIIVFLRRVGPASPSEIGEYTGLSRTTVTRRLRDLHHLGFVSKAGKTRSVRYEMADGEHTGFARCGEASGASCGDKTGAPAGALPASAGASNDAS